MYFFRLQILIECYLHRVHVSKFDSGYVFYSILYPALGVNWLLTVSLGESFLAFYRNIQLINVSFFF